MTRRGLTLVEIIVTIGILSLIILSLITSSIFIVRSSQMISETQLIKSKLTYYYYNGVFAPFFITDAVYNPNKLFQYTRSTRGILENHRLKVEDVNFNAIQILEELKTKLREDIEMKDRGIEIESVDIKLSDKPIVSVIIDETDDSSKTTPRRYRIKATLAWFNVRIEYRTRDNRILSITMELPIINNVDSSNIIPEDDKGGNGNHPGSTPPIFRPASPHKSN
ncbi:MAG: hypothetical protein RMJ51_00710 [Candidatus Calescibacterium sp.]|nr:hypothetical protein [Candidatus Calescibacterium sp.]MDW8194754.1 hypothetical protein [Candidatus Calescibacterium sp.]